MKNIISVVLLFIFPAICAASEVKWPHRTTLPRCPDGCTIVAYGPIPLTRALIKRIEEYGSIMNLLKSASIEFPTDGFAIYYEPTSTLFVATTPEMQENVYAVITPTCISEPDWSFQLKAEQGAAANP